MHTIPSAIIVDQAQHHVWCLCFANISSTTMLTDFVQFQHALWDFLHYYSSFRTYSVPLDTKMFGRDDKHSKFTVSLLKKKIDMLNVQIYSHISLRERVKSLTSTASESPNLTVLTKSLGEVGDSSFRWRPDASAPDKGIQQTCETLHNLVNSSSGKATIAGQGCNLDFTVNTMCS